MRNLVSLILLFAVSSLIAQELVIDFEDRNMSSWYSPLLNRWTVFGSKPISGSFSLQHSFDNSESAEDWISIFHDPVIMEENGAVWEFAIRYDYAPSSNNRWAILLGHDCLFEEGGFENALILGVNFTGSDDMIRIWRKQGREVGVLLNTLFNWEKQVKKSQVVHFRLSLQKQGILILETDVGGSGFIQIGNARIKPPEIVNTFLILYKYSSTFDRGLAIDDIHISGHFQQDIEGPLLYSSQVTDSNRLLLTFNEVVPFPATSTPCIDNVGCAISSVTAGKGIELLFSENFLPGTLYTVHLQGIMDIAGNSMQNPVSDFYYHGAYDVIINEIMADPDPPVGLPGVEYIELFNRSVHEIALRDWKLTVNNRVCKLPDIILSHGAYSIVCDRTGSELFNEGMNVIGIESFPGIRNSDARILLQDYKGRLIHAVDYDDSWHQHGKADGGWSVELINPGNPCIDVLNWSSSTEPGGGTPARVNSVYNEQSEELHTELWRASVTGLNSVRLYFSGAPDSISTSSVNYYLVDQDIGNPGRISPSWPIAASIDLEFRKNFIPGINYEIRLSNDPFDCTGYPLNQRSVNFMVPEYGQHGDIVINEIMFDPHEDHTEYLELYNACTHTVELINWKLSLNGKQERVLTEEYFSLLPGDYALIASSLKGINSSAIFNRAAKIILMPAMPSLPNSGAQISLYDSSGYLIDAVQYETGWHHEFIDPAKGVSLERLSSEISGMLPGNWTSAATAAGYQSPAAPNSQNMVVERVSALYLSLNSITPNEDGLNDRMDICYVLEKQGCMGRIMVFDIMGRCCRILANGALLGSEGCFEFNGKDYSNDPLPTGYYILYFEAYDGSGFFFAEKRSIIIAGLQ